MYQEISFISTNKTKITVCKNTCHQTDAKTKLSPLLVYGYYLSSTTYHAVEEIRLHFTKFDFISLIYA